MLVFGDPCHIIEGAINLNVMKICTFSAILVIQRVTHCKVLNFFLYKTYHGYQHFLGKDQIGTSKTHSENFLKNFEFWSYAETLPLNA